MDGMTELADVNQMNPEALVKVDDKRTLIEEQSSDSMPSIVNIVSMREDTNSPVGMEIEHTTNSAPKIKDEDEPEDSKAKGQMNVKLMQLRSSSASKAVPTACTENDQIMVEDDVKQETFKMEDETTTRPFSQSSAVSKVSSAEVKRRPVSSVQEFKVKDEPVEDEENYTTLLLNPSAEEINEEPNGTVANLKISAVFSLRGASSQSETPADVVALPQAVGIPTSSSVSAPPAPPPAVHASCSACRKILVNGQTAFQKKGSKELYCCTACLSCHIQPTVKLKSQCHYCLKIIESLSEVIVAPVNSTGTMKNFCSNMCIFNCTRNSALPVPSSAAPVPKGPPSKCSHCTKYCTSKHEVNMKGSVHKLCSDKCFIGFHADHTCCNCGQYCYIRVLTMELDNVSKTFCKAECVSVYKQRFKKPSSCTMCLDSRPICDMVEMTDAKGKVDLFCTSSCGTAYKVQTASTSALRCDRCNKLSVPAYHLAKSDGSVWSFCTLPCVLAFQEKSSKTDQRFTVAVSPPTRTIAPAPSITIAPTPITVPPLTSTVPPPNSSVPPPTSIVAPAPRTITPAPSLTVRPSTSNVPPPTSTVTSATLPATTSTASTSTTTTIPAVDDVKPPCSQCCSFISSKAVLVQHKSELYYFCGADCCEEFKQINFGTEISAQAPDTTVSKNSVRSLIKNPFKRRSLVEQLKVKELGPDKPDIQIRQEASKKGKTYLRGFPPVWYKRKAWLAGCSSVNAVFCFPCLLFKTEGTDTTWTVTGVRDMKHLAEKVKKHECTKAHMKNTVKLAMLGRVSIATQLDQGHRIGVRKHNEEVCKNRHILSKIIDGIKFCGAFEQALRIHNETESSDHPGVFRGLVDLDASLGGVLEEHLKMDTVFKDGSKTVQNELLDCMLSVLKNYIVEEVKKADYLAIQVDETTDNSARCQLALLLRYIDRHSNVQERFFEFIPLQNAPANTIATALLERLGTLLPEGQESRLIAQAYDGAALMREATGGVQRKVIAVYRNAHHVHCYSHQLNLVMQQATSHIPKIGLFFSDLEGFAAFFSRSSKRTAVLDQVVGQKRPGTSKMKWDFHSHAVTAVYKHKDDLLQCFQTIRDSSNFDPATVREAGGFVRMLEDQEFCFFLMLFHLITPHVDTLFNQLQKKDIDPVYITEIIQRFTDRMKSIRDCIPSGHGDHCGPVQQQAAKRRRTLDRGMHQTVCDIILHHAKERFSFTNHLVSATMLLGDLFREHCLKFPETALEFTLEAYPMLNKAKLKTELSLIYENDEFEACSGALALLRFFKENNLQGTFTETVSLLKILITTPMTTAESERCFSTSQTIKTFLRNTVTHDRLDALAMLSVEKELIRTIPDFNNRVIEKFAAQKYRRTKLMYK